MNERRLVIIAGPNGSGKSSITNLAYSNNIIDKGYPYLCADNIAIQLAKNNGIELSEDIYIEARKETQTIKNEFIKNNKSFVYESLVSHISHINFFKFAKGNGYKIIVFFIATDNPEINIKRVAKRVCEGGHNVPLEKIKPRYERCLKLLPDLIKIADEIYIYDNSKDDEPAQLCVSAENGIITYYEPATLHSWVENSIG